ncbi:hypothetical protein [Ectobacillus panaciterrae]|uniref:hypothetical protein n=1 Tax=Ectobacillus panaciterrae TaxID=363872 RepID=UPI0009D792E1
MFKKFFSFSNPVGLIVSSAVLILTVSPEARKGTRKLLVKGAGAALALGDQMKGLTTGVQKQLGTFVEEAKAERETMMLPDMAGMVKEGGDMLKHSFEEGVTKTKQAMETAKDAVSGLFEDNMVTQGFEEGATKTKQAMETATDDVAGLFEDNMVTHGFEEGVTKTKQAMETATDNVAAGLFEGTEPNHVHNQFTAYNVLDDHSIQMKLNEIEQRLY